MSKLQDFLDRHHLMQDRAELVKRAQEIADEIAAVDGRLRNGAGVADIVRGVMLSRPRSEVGLDSHTVSALFEDKESRSAEVYWCRFDPAVWLVRVCSGSAFTSRYEVLGLEKDFQWTQEQARNVAWNWLIYGRRSDATPFSFSEGEPTPFLADGV